MFIWSDWFSITPYSFIDLAVFAICFALAAAFYLIYYKLGRRLVDLVFANCLASITIMAFGFFTEDNTESPLVALRWARINYSMGAFFTASFLHFVSEFLKERSRLSDRIVLGAYGMSFIAAVATFSDKFFAIRARPLEPRSWANVSPALPEVSTAQIAFTAVFLIIAGFTLYKLYHALSKHLVEARSVYRTRILFYGTSVLSVFFVVDYTLYALTSVCTVPLALLGFLAVCLAAAIALGEELIDSHRLKEALSKYVSPQVTKQILDKGLLLEGKECEVTVLFADIRGFTGLTRELGPQATSRFLNKYLGKMTAVIARHDGILIQTVGDGLLAVFGAPGTQKEHEWAATKAALDMMTALEELNCEEDSRVGRVRIGLGLHSGEAVIGNVGGGEHVDYRVTGDVVNIASRVEQYSKVVGQPLLVTEATYAKIQRFVSAEPVGEAPIKPGEASIAVWAVFGARESEHAPSNSSEGGSRFTQTTMLAAGSEKR